MPFYASRRTGGRGGRMKLLQRHPYKKHVTPDGTFLSKRTTPAK